MPVLLAVVAEGRVAVGRHAVQLGTVGTAGGDDGVRAVGRRTPARVGQRDQVAAEHELLVLADEGGALVAAGGGREQLVDVVGVQAFAALRTRDCDARLGDLKLEVLAQAADAERVATRLQLE